MKKSKLPEKPKIRDTQLSAYVTEQDAAIIRQFAQNVGFKSTSQMLTAIVERLIIGGFAPMVFAKIGLQIVDYAEANGYKYKGKRYFGIRPLPALPDNGMSDQQLKEKIGKLCDEAIAAAVPA